jgi:hypothetical protein
MLNFLRTTRDHKIWTHQRKRQESLKTPAFIKILSDLKIVYPLIARLYEQGADSVSIGQYISNGGSGFRVLLFS